MTTKKEKEEREKRSTDNKFTEENAMIELTKDSPRLHAKLYRGLSETKVAGSAPTISLTEGSSHHSEEVRQTVYHCHQGCT